VIIFGIIGACAALSCCGMTLRADLLTSIVVSGDIICIYIIAQQDVRVTNKLSLTVHCEFGKAFENIQYDASRVWIMDTDWGACTYSLIMPFPTPSELNFNWIP
jgi:hypothetical protein